jgi:hypothetical protein
MVFREKPRIEYHCSMGITLYSPRTIHAIVPGEAATENEVAALFRPLTRAETATSVEDESGGRR